MGICRGGGGKPAMLALRTRFVTDDNHRATSGQLSYYNSKNINHRD